MNRKRRIQNTPETVTHQSIQLGNQKLENVPIYLSSIQMNCNFQSVINKPLFSKCFFILMKSQLGMFTVILSHRCWHPAKYFQKCLFLLYRYRSITDYPAPLVPELFTMLSVLPGQKRSRPAGGETQMTANKVGLGSGIWEWI